MTQPSIDHAQIQETAYLIWLDAGQPQGCDQEHWLKAIDALTPVQPKAKPARKAPAKPRVTKAKAAPKAAKTVEAKAAAKATSAAKKPRATKAKKPAAK